ncbi:MAG: DUF3473 domain-containing protein [Gemmatimonadales bacterium]|nr:MAG: DUF3473 domain-containing protein [Gemmatimonadales bacterium]
MADSAVVHHFTVDVEEHFQVSALEGWVDRGSWDRRPSRVVRATGRILDLLGERGVKGTFFVLGWVAERQPDLVRRIAAEGHEVASHGWDHRRVTMLEPAEFRRQVRDSRALLEEVSGMEVTGYRAPSFSIVPGREWALRILAEEGYRWDSSLYPVRRRGYGYPGARRDIHRLPRKDGGLVEVPPMTLRVGGMNLPAGGGGTFRQLPEGWTRAALRQCEARGRPGTFYIHPWEVDPEQPREEGLPLTTRIRHYRGLPRTLDRLARMLDRHAFGPVARSLSVLLLALGVLAGCVDRAPEGPVSERESPPAPLATCPAPGAGDVEVEVLAAGLEVVWGIGVLPDGRLLVAERPGRIRVVEGGELLDDPWVELDVEDREEAGLLGMVVDRGFEENGRVWVVSSHLRTGPLDGVPLVGPALRALRMRTAGDAGTPFVNRVHLLEEAADGSVEATVWVDGLPTNQIHAGGGLVQTPGGDLLLGLGDGMDPWRSQQPESLRGKLVRVPGGDTPPRDRRLRAPRDVEALGVRNSQGIQWIDPDSTVAVFIDHGPVGKDELNLLVEGGNYGWPAEAGVHPEPRFQPPLVEWTPALAPGGLAARPGTRAHPEHPDSATAWVAGLGGRALLEVRLGREAGGSWAAACQDTLVAGQDRFRAVVEAPGGGLLVGTSNRDGRGIAGEGDDRLLHVRWTNHDP